MSGEAHISISKFSIITHLSQKALRIYDKRGLLIPYVKDEFTGYRYYTTDQITTGIKIKMLVSLGFSLSDVHILLEVVQDREIINSIFSKRLNELQMEINRLNRIEDLLISNDPMELLYLNCAEPTIKKIAKNRVLSLREKGTYKETIGKIINEILEVINENELKITGPIMFISYDDDYKEFDADIEIAIPVSGRISLNREDMEVKNLNSENVISLIYTGSYQDIGIAYNKVFEYINQNEYEITGRSRELYLNSPIQVKENELLTEIQIPVRRK